MPRKRKTLVETATLRGVPSDLTDHRAVAAYLRLVIRDIHIVLQPSATRDPVMKVQCLAVLLDADRDAAYVKVANKRDMCDMIKALL